MPKSCRAATVELVGFESRDLACLKKILAADDCLGPDCQLQIRHHETAETTVSVLHRDSIPIVLCDHDNSPGAWKQLLEQFADLPEPPLLIVTSRLADDQLWAEAINLGAHDVLAKPFADAEVVRTARLAYLRWQRLHPAPETVNHMVA